VLEFRVEACGGPKQRLGTVVLGQLVEQHTGQVEQHRLARLPLQRIQQSARGGGKDGRPQPGLGRPIGQRRLGDAAAWYARCRSCQPSSSANSPASSRSCPAAMAAAGRVVASSTRARQPAAAVAASPGVGAGDGCIAGVIGCVKAWFSSRSCRRSRG
jgi:hypothetical protein